MSAVVVEVTPVVTFNHLELTALSHSSDSTSVSTSAASSPEMSLNMSTPNTPPASSPAPASSQPCPQPSPLNGVTAASPVGLSHLSLDALSVPPPLPAVTETTRRSTLPIFRHLFYIFASPFAPIPHRWRFARRLFRFLSHPLTLLCASLVMLTLHLMLLYASTNGLYLLYVSKPRLSRLATVVFTLFLSFLVVRSCITLAMVSLRVLQPHLWINLPPANASRVSRRYYPTLLLLRVLSLLFLLIATAVLIFATPLSLSTPSLLVVFMLLSYDAITLSMPLLIVPSLAFLIPLHALHMSFPFIPITAPHPPTAHPGMSASQLAQLEQSVWQRQSMDGESDVCAVCLCELSEGERVRRLPKCSHVFHVACIDSWLERRAKCPLCVQTVVVSQHAVDVLV